MGRKSTSGRRCGGCGDRRKRPTATPVRIAGTTEVRHESRRRRAIRAHRSDRAEGRPAPAHGARTVADPGRGRRDRLCRWPENPGPLSDQGSPALHSRDRVRRDRGRSSRQAGWLSARHARDGHDALGRAGRRDRRQARSAVSLAGRRCGRSRGLLSCQLPDRALCAQCTRLALRWRAASGAGRSRRHGNRCSPDWQAARRARDRSGLDTGQARVRAGTRRRRRDRLHAGRLARQSGLPPARSPRCPSICHC